MSSSTRECLIARDRPLDPDHLRRRLAQQVDQVLSEKENAPRYVVRLVLPVKPLDPFSWLQAQALPDKVYWSGRNDAETVAAVGAADRCAGSHLPRVTALEQELDLLRTANNARLRYYGGLRFDTEPAPDDDWSPFATYQFVLPRFELCTTARQATLICNLVLPRDAHRRAAIQDQVRRLRFPSRPLGGALPMPIARTDEPDAEGWRRMIEQSLSELAATRLGKVVLARKAVFGFEESLDAALLLKNLQRATPGCFHFYFQPDASSAFVGASPERLFRRHGSALWSEAVAGTRPRADTAPDDARLREELLGSEKDQREHDYVRRHLRDALRPLCTALTLDEHASEMKLARGRHLYSGLRGTLREDTSSLDVLAALHPTPAVGGTPRADALRAIRRLEPFDRGWYAGPVGWIGPDAAEFAVAIRSGLVQPERLALFSGAGIVDGSAPQSEWDEIEQKISDFVDVLGLDRQAALAEPVSNSS